MSLSLIQSILIFIARKETMNKKTYQVDVYEVWTRSFTIEANSKAEARDLANKHIEHGVEGCFDYSHTMDVDDWNVEDITNQLEGANRNQYLTEIVAKTVLDENGD